MTSVSLLSRDGALHRHQLRPARGFERPDAPSRTRIAYAAAHVVPRRAAENVPGSRADIDWDATIDFRRHLWSWGLGVADAMDTAQRNMGLDWPATMELIRRSAEAAREAKGALLVGAGTDHLPDRAVTLPRVVDAYREQLDVIGDAGAEPVLMASRHLARAATGPEDFERVYARVIDHAERPVVLHWLGPAFDPHLAGYWGSADVTTAAACLLRIIERDPSRVRGVKVSVLDAGLEVGLRRRLPSGVRMFTGDDLHYVDLIAGDEQGASDALLGAFAAIGPVASVALHRLDEGDDSGYRALLEPTLALSRHLFSAPTSSYKTGIAFLSWLNGYQPSPAMVGGMHSSRSLVHLAELLRLADESGVLEQPELAAGRWRALLKMNGFG